MNKINLKDVCLAIDKRNKEFYNSLDQREKDAVFEAVENYRNIIKELKLNRYIK